MDIGGDPMTKTQADMVASARQRRRWSRAEKERIVAAAMEPGAVASAVAREAGIQASQLFRWRRQLHGTQRFASLTLVATTLHASPGALVVVEWFPEPAGLRVVDQSEVAGVIRNDSNYMDVTQTFTGAWVAWVGSVLESCNGLN